jgi:hypothetical protein
LTERFGGLTALTRSPAHGTTTESGKPAHDETVVFEVMSLALDVSWWESYRASPGARVSSGSDRYPCIDRHSALTQPGKTSAGFPGRQY